MSNNVLPGWFWKLPAPFIFVYLKLLSYLPAGNALDSSSAAVPGDIRVQRPKTSQLKTPYNRQKVIPKFQKN
jgi:hypothetical protein